MFVDFVLSYQNHRIKCLFVFLFNFEFLASQVDMQAVFLLAEATQSLLKNMISKISARSRMKQALLKRALYEEHVRQTEIKNERILAGHAKRMENPQRKFEVDKKLERCLNFVVVVVYLMFIYFQCCSCCCQDFYDQ